MYGSYAPHGFAARPHNIDLSPQPERRRYAITVHCVIPTRSGPSVKAGLTPPNQDIIYLFTNLANRSINITAHST